MPPPEVRADGSQVTRGDGQRGRVAILGLVLILGAWIVLKAARSRGFLWGDDYTHLLISRSVPSNPRALLDVWGRPLMTLSYLPASLIGEAAVRITSLVMLAATAVLCWRIAASRLLPLAPLGAALLLGQPITAQAGFAALPELPFCLLVAVALWLRGRDQQLAAGIVVGLLPLARLEGLVVVAVWAVFVVMERRWRVLPALCVGSAAWALTGALVNGDLLWIVHANPYRLLGSPYGSAGWTFIALAWSRAYGPVIGALAIAGAVLAPRAHRLEVAILSAMAVFYAVAWGMPLFSTIATPYYLVSAAVPAALVAHSALGQLLAGSRSSRTAVVMVVAVLAVCGVEFAQVHSGSLAFLTAAVLALIAATRVFTTASVRTGLVGVALAGVLVVAVDQVRSLPLSPTTLEGIQFADALQARGIHVAWTTDPSFAWHLRDTGTVLGGPRQRVADLPSGRYAVWDSHLGGKLNPAELDRLGIVIAGTAGPPANRYTLLHRLSRR